MVYVAEFEGLEGFEGFRCCVVWFDGVAVEGIEGFRCCAVYVEV